MFVFVETPLFTRLVSEYLSDDEYLELQRALARNPEAGPIIPGSGGVRKVRWALPVGASVADYASSTTCVPARA